MTDEREGMKALCRKAKQPLYVYAGKDHALRVPCLLCGKPDMEVLPGEVSLGEIRPREAVVRAAAWKPDGIKSCYDGLQCMASSVVDQQRENGCKTHPNVAWRMTNIQSDRRNR